MDDDHEVRVEFAKRAVKSVLNRMDQSQRREFADLMEGPPEVLRGASETQLAMIRLLATVAFIQVMGE
jgi:hypothetical protein